MTEPVQHTHDGHKGRFFLSIDGTLAAEMTYSMAGDVKMIIDHTEVNDLHRGKSLGAHLVEAAVQYARENNIKILPLCPFAKAQLQRHTEWHDVLV